VDRAINAILNDFVLLAHEVAFFMPLINQTKRRKGFYKRKELFCADL